LWHKHGEAFASAPSFDEFAHWQFVAAVAAVLQRRGEPGRAFGQDNISLDNDRIA